MIDRPITFVAHLDEVRFSRGHKLMGVILRDNLAAEIAKIAGFYAAGENYTIYAGAYVPHEKLPALIYEASKALAGHNG